MVTLFIISFVCFLSYIFSCIWLFGIPQSISDTYYLLKRRKAKNICNIFTLFCFAVSFTLIIPWIDITENISPNISFLPFFACGGLAFVGAASAFKDMDLVRKVHFSSAFLCAGSSIMWSILMGYWYIPLFCFTIYSSVFIIKRERVNYMFWSELAAFMSLFANLGVIIF